MTEFKRTLQAVDDIEIIVQDLLDNTAAEDAVQRLGQLLGNTIPSIQKMSRKAAEADPLKQTYGPQMREKVLALVERWLSFEGLAQDVLAQKGGSIAAPSDSGAPPPPPPRAAEVQWQPPQASQTPVLPRPPVIENRDERRDLAARAAEARNLGNPSSSSQATSSAASTSSPLTQAPPAVIPVVSRMDSLMNLVHCVFLGHGFARDDASTDVFSSSPGPFRIRYVHKTHPSVLATYVPVQRHLITYCSQEGFDDTYVRATVTLGMVAASVQAKVDYLILYPLVYRLRAPALPSIPPEVLFGLLTNFSIPVLAKVGFASKGFAAAVFEDDILWWRVSLALPSSSQLSTAVERANTSRQKGEELPRGCYRKIVRDEVQRVRAEAEERRRRRDEAEALRRSMRDPLLVQPPRRPQPLPGLGPGMVIGGPHDLFPGGFRDPFRLGPGGRNPFGGGGGFFG